MQSRPLRSSLNPRNQRGITPVQVMMGLAVMGIFSVTLWAQFSGITSAATNQSAYEEAARWVTEAQTVSLLNGYNNTTTNVANAAALISETNLTTATNVWSQTITVAASGGNINITYPIGGQDAAAAEANCSLVRSRFIAADGTSPSLSALDAAPAACTSGNPSNLVLVIE